MSISVERLENKITITINVEKFDVVNMQEIKKSIQKEINNELSDVILDLSEVSFIDSSGLSVIIAIFKQLNTTNHKFELSGLQTQPMELLEITQLHKIFTIINNSNA